ncbi:aspartate-semialdehyde dehydrogenase [Thiofilum flexile]|uniref:aspartate-semialdehyde dehydrogenase n=1 Tax=Thiofilum flexile TaxID=125627 RepID=UPI00036C1FE3|nr:aspartate-semialdehyde dehydrogenase [Thiofilum flexile]
MIRKYTVAVVGAKTLVGETLMELLAERNFPIEKLNALAKVSFWDEDVDFGRRTLDVQDIEAFDFTTVELAFFIEADLAADYGEEAAQAGCVVIDLSGHFSGREGVPLVIPEVNPAAVSEYKNHNMLVNPLSTTIQALMALKPLDDAAKITRINITSYQAVSSSGKAGIDELANQTAQLLNARPIDTKLYPKQIAFNVLPQINALQDNGYTVDENRFMQEVRSLLMSPHLGVNPTFVRVPVFFGDALALHIETEHKLSTDQAYELLRQAVGVTVMEANEDEGYPTPVTEAANEEAVFIGRIREDYSHPCGLDLWVVADNVRKGAALNAVQIAELLVQEW